jgi:hypothetical protein
MSRHTPPRPVAVAELFPELVSLRREAVRLHPRPGKPTCRESSVGGPLLWPGDELWPECAEEHFDLDGTPYGVMPLVPVAQVYQAGAPSVPYAPGCDLLQVLWCPFNHYDCECPRPWVYWRDSGSVGQVADTPPAPPEAPENYVPSPCVVHPERVTEYPRWDMPGDLYHDLEKRFTRLHDDTGWSYGSDLSDAPGTKLGGYPGWTQPPDWPDCESCGQRMEHLLTVASWECDSATWRTWLPVEDRELLKGQEEVQTKLNLSVTQAAGLMLGDAGGVYIFECLSCPGRPTSHRFDCS